MYSWIVATGLIYSLKKIVLELKALDQFSPVHHAQVLTYLKLGGYKLGLLLNFNVPVMKQGIQRIIN